MTSRAATTAAASYSFWQLPKRALRNGPRSLKLVTSDVPVPAAGQVLIRVRAVSLNYLDPLLARNEYEGRVKESPLIPVSDGVGEVVAIGSSDNNTSSSYDDGDDEPLFKVGDRVAANLNIAHTHGPICAAADAKHMLGFSRDGMLSQYVVLPATGIVRIPDKLTFEQAATLPCCAVTSWNALHGLRDAPLLPGATIVCEGTGAVSLFAAQIGIASGAKVVITSSSDEKLAIVRDMFTMEQQKRLFGINYRKTPDWDKEVLRISPQGATHIIEIGGGSTLERAHACVKRAGVVVNIGFVATEGEMPNIPLMNLVSHSLYRGFIVGSVEQFQQLLECIDAFDFKPVIHKTFTFDQAPQAFEYISSPEAQGQIGKIVITL